MPLTVQQSFLKAKAQIVETLVHQHTWQIAELKSVVISICAIWGVDPDQMMHRLGLA
jgi:hypothetical protein